MFIYLRKKFLTKNAQPQSRIELYQTISTQAKCLSICLQKSKKTSHIFTISEERLKMRKMKGKIRKT
jgi:hypothetical protein